MRSDGDWQASFGRFEKRPGITLDTNWRVVRVLYFYRDDGVHDRRFMDALGQTAGRGDCLTA